ncbi:MAG: Rab family GTPase [Promethearchaeota archaeon]
MSTYKLKILLCGPAAVGKTSLIHRFIKSKFERDYKLTVGVDILTKNVEYAAGKTATLSIWDIGGQERFSFIRTTFYKGASGALLVFDLSRSSTFGSIKNWRSEVVQFAGNIPFVLIGNKLDLIPEVGEVIDRDECKEYAEDEGSIYIETSAKDGTNVDEAFIELTRLIVAKNEGK